MVEYDRPNKDKSNWQKIMDKTRDLRDKIWSGDELEDRDDG